jgi:8-oxo-dGTP pyrophosphatase MutT (NUDIX family)
MERILRAEPGWQERVAAALARAERPIQADPRFTPRAPADAAPDELLPRFDRATFPPARAAATLLLLYPGPDGELTLPLTVRHADLRAHAGEISLPGGAVDSTDASREAAALREAWEEIGVPPASVQLLGALDDVWIPVSNFELRPFVGAATRRPDLVPHTDEVAAIIEVPVRRLFDPDGIGEELIEGRGWRVRAGVYRHDEHRIWGATARALAMFAAVLGSEAGPPAPDEAA